VKAAEATARGAVPRHTRQLEATYQVLRMATDHPTADQVLARVRDSLPAVSRGTVYRNLAKLVGDGRLRVVPVNRVARYDARLDAHDHFVCAECGAVLDVPARAAAESLPPSLEGHVVQGVARTYHGRCSRCARLNGAERISS
jgi:Fe2+ or Zn2+ uptake regulation protein